MTRKTEHKAPDEKHDPLATFTSELLGYLEIAIARGDKAAAEKIHTALGIWMAGPRGA